MFNFGWISLTFNFICAGIITLVLLISFFYICTLITFTSFHICIFILFYWSYFSSSYPCTHSVILTPTVHSFTYSEFHASSTDIIFDGQNEQEPILFLII